MLKVSNHWAGTIYDITIFIQLRFLITISREIFVCTLQFLSFIKKIDSSIRLLYTAPAFLRYELLHGTFVRKKISFMLHTLFIVCVCVQMPAF